MTNLAIENGLKHLSIPFLRAKVGDRYVMEKLCEQDWYLGGESSGHIICRDKHTTGDGIISALQVLYALRDNNQTLSELLKEIKLYPQRLINVKVNRSFKFSEDSLIQNVIGEAELDLNAKGRVLLRASGTEPVIRVMVEGESDQKVNFWANRIADVVQKNCNTAD
jgi:phosphoglucosamine mutase